MKYNETIDLQVNHRTIRDYKEEGLREEDLKTLLEVARRTASSSGMQAASIIRVTSVEMKKEFAKICRQKYVEKVPELLIFVMDQYRNNNLAKETGAEFHHGDDMDKFFQGFTDASIMAQNVVVAAESLGYGTVFFGSILNDPEKTIKLLNLPKLTFPVVGLGIGMPNQEPQLKPRMDMEFRVFENGYVRHDGEYLKLLEDYDQEMTTYYDLRESNSRSDSFSKQAVAKMTNSIPERADIMNAIVAQGFDLRLKK
ncbi:MAG: NADPH-dependent oxidoreductase [Clostridiaceae bacterium]